MSNKRDETKKLFPVYSKVEFSEETHPGRIFPKSSVFSDLTVCLHVDKGRNRIENKTLKKKLRMCGHKLVIFIFFFFSFV